MLPVFVHKMPILRYKSSNASFRLISAEISQQATLQDGHILHLLSGVLGRCGELWPAYEWFEALEVT